MPLPEMLFTASVVEEKFLRIEDRPQDILVAVALRPQRIERLAIGAVAWLFQMRPREGNLRGIRLARVGELVKFAQLFLVAPRVGGELRGASGVGRKLILD